MTPTHDGIQGQTVGKLTRTDSENAIWMAVDIFYDGLKFPFQVYENSEGRLIEIGLKDAIAAIKRAIGPYVKNLISATNVIIGPGARLEHLAGKGEQPEGFLIHVQVPETLSAVVFW